MFCFSYTVFIFFQCVYMSIRNGNIYYWKGFTRESHYHPSSMSNNLTKSLEYYRTRRARETTKMSLENKN